MRRIKIVVSDFHLGTGRVASDGTINDLEDFLSDQAFVDLMEYYRTGEYVDAEVELILNGDIFECLALTEDNDTEPEMITVQKSLAKVDRIIEGHEELFAAMRTFAAGERRQVTFIVGNHDQDLLWGEVQERLRERIHPAIRVINDVYRFDGVHVEHGNQHDLQNRYDPERMFLTRGLEQPVLNLPWGSDLFVSCFLKLKRLRPYANRVRPFRLAMWWSLFHDLGILLRGLWTFFVALLRARFRRVRACRITFLETLRVVLSGSAYPTLEDEATKLLRSDSSIRFVVFGHTHIPMSRQLLPGRMYFNSGSWIPNSNLHIAALGRTLQQTYVYIEYDSDQPRGRLKLWHGRRMVEEDVVL